MLPELWQKKLVDFNISSLRTSEVQRDTKLYKQLKAENRLTKDKIIK